MGQKRMPTATTLPSPDHPRQADAATRFSLPVPPKFGQRERQIVPCLACSRRACKRCPIFGFRFDNRPARRRNWRN